MRRPRPLYATVTVGLLYASAAAGCAAPTASSDASPDLPADGFMTNSTGVYSGQALAPEIRTDGTTEFDSGDFIRGR